MDMYQKRKIRAEMKNINQEEKLIKVGIYQLIFVFWKLFSSFDILITTSFI